ncbi:MAG: dihydroxyacetone kinase subunit DhaK [Actinobacteria bacterium]|nr:dihydroxyacetone kinase subunit DhaK [Actinomycetota bacterium]
MKKFINDPDNVVNESLEGYIDAYPDTVKIMEDARVLIRKNEPSFPKVGVITGGGSGHKPAFLGYVGEGLCDAAAIGEIFAAPPADWIHKATKKLDMGKGVIYLYGNFSGDLMNFRMARTLAEADGIQVEEVIAKDDIASSPKESMEKRRAVAGEVIMWKVGGAAAAEGMVLKDVKEAALRAVFNTRSMGVGTYPCIIPATGKPSFKLEEDEMEVGIGHHGEPGIRKEKMKTADETTAMLMDALIDDLPFKSGDTVSVMVNGLGATPLQELFIINRKVSQILEKYKIKKLITYAGEYFTSLEMAGFSITLTKIDDLLERLILAKADSPLFKQFQLY